MASIKKSESRRPEPEVIEMRRSSRFLDEGRGESSDGADGDRILCFCGSDRESSEMACCELCSGWFHFRCMRFKEKAELLENRDFVCCFCLASKTLVLLKEVDALREEVRELRGVIRNGGIVEVKG